MSDSNSRTEEVRPVRWTELEEEDADGIGSGGEAPYPTSLPGEPGAEGAFVPLRGAGGLPGLSEEPVVRRVRKFEPVEFEGSFDGPTSPAAIDEPVPPGLMSSRKGGVSESESDRARQEAQEVVAQAKKEADSIRSQAHRDGFEAGRSEGLRRLEEAASSFEAVVAELAGYKAPLFEQARSQTVELALAVVRKLMGPLAESDADAVVRVVERALQLLSDRENLTLRVHPEDMRSVLESKPQILENFDGIQKLTVLEDPSVRRGGCLVQTPSAEIDARLDTQLQEITRVIRNA